MCNFKQKNANAQEIALQGHVALTDFGLCKQCFEGKNTATTFCGTPEVRVRLYFLWTGERSRLIVLPLFVY